MSSISIHKPGRKPIVVTKTINTNDDDGDDDDFDTPVADVRKPHYNGTATAETKRKRSNEDSDETSQSSQDENQEYEEDNETDGSGNENEDEDENSNYDESDESDENDKEKEQEKTHKVALKPARKMTIGEQLAKAAALQATTSTSMLPPPPQTQRKSITTVSNLPIASDETASSVARKPSRQQKKPDAKRARRVQFSVPEEVVSDTLEINGDKRTTSSRTAERIGGGDMISRRPSDISYRLETPKPTLVPESLQPSTAVFQTERTDEATENGADTESVSFQNLLPLTEYERAARLVVRGTLRAAEFKTPAIEEDKNATKDDDQSQKGTVSKIDVSASSSNSVLQSAYLQALNPSGGLQVAAYCNDMIRATKDRGFANSRGVSSLRQTPFVNSNMTTFVRTFVSAAMSGTPDDNVSEHMNQEEQRWLSTAIDRDYALMFFRSARAKEFRCAKGDRCYFMDLYDNQGYPIVKRIGTVYWKPQEVDTVRNTPQKVSAEAAERYCLGCKWNDAGILHNSAAMHGTTYGTNFVLCDTHVLVNMKQQFPVEQTIGLASDGFRGLMNNIPIMPKTGWVAEPDPHHSGCFIYRNEGMVPYPIPPAYYHRDSPASPLTLMGNQAAPTQQPFQSRGF